MNEIQMRMLHKLSSNHRYLLENQSGECRMTCFYCLQTSHVSEVKEWIDKEDTALCPQCGIDSILPGTLSDEDRQSMHNFYFDRDATPS